MKKDSQKLTPRCSGTGAVLYFAMAAAVVVLDQWSKAAVVANIPLYGEVPVISWLFQLTNVRNTGAAWSLLAQHTGVLAAVSILAALAISAYMLFGNLCPAARLMLGFVIGGAVGNLIDRVRLGYVVDMIDLTFMNYPVFNVADCFIVVGGILFSLIFIFWNDRYLISHGLLQITEPAEDSDADKTDS